MFQLKNKFLRYSARERKQIIIIVLLGFLGAYGLLAAHMWQTLFEATKMADRRANRIETRIGHYTPPEIDSSLSVKDLDAAKAQLKQIEATLIDYSKQLLPLDTPESRENLKLEVTRLATQHHITITNMTSSNTAIRPLPSELSGEKLRKIFSQRPLFNLKGRGHFYNVIHFMESLKKLPYQSLVPNMTIMRPDDESLTGDVIFQFDLQM